MTGHQPISAGEKWVACPEKGLLSCNKKGYAILRISLMRDAFNNRTLKYPAVIPSFFLPFNCSATFPLPFLSFSAYGQIREKFPEARDLNRRARSSQSTDRKPTLRLPVYARYPFFQLRLKTLDRYIQHEELGIIFPTSVYSIRLLPLHRTRSDTFAWAQSG